MSFYVILRYYIECLRKRKYLGYVRDPSIRGENMKFEGSKYPDTVDISVSTNALVLLNELYICFITVEICKVYFLSYLILFNFADGNL